VNFLQPEEEKYIFAFQNDINKSKKFMELDEDEEESEYQSNKYFQTIKEFKDKSDKDERIEEEEK